MSVDIYIVDQTHEVQRKALPNDALPGFVVEVWRKGKRIESMWNKTRSQAEFIAQEYHKQYAINDILEGRAPVC